MSEEIKNENTAEKLDNPLVVHKKGDASYEESASPVEMNETHSEEEETQLRRHRFRKEKKGYGGLIAFLIILVIIASVFAGLYMTGNIRFVDKTTTTKKATTTEAVTTLEELYKGTIVVKGTYIFVDGYEVNGTQGLEKALKYEDKSTTAYTIIDENANADYLNYDILPLLSELGFYGEDTVITHKESTGLLAEAETTTLPPETTTTTASTTTTAPATTE